MNPAPLYRVALLAGACVASFGAQPVIAQDQVEDTSPPARPPAEPEQEQRNELGTGSGEIVVNAQRLRGQLDVEQEPLLELNEDDIAAEGVTSIADLITQLTNQTGSARGRGADGGRPVILINGIRIGSFREFRNYPPEALARVEVFPEEVALRFGFPPDRRVINLILKENYRNAEVELEFEGPSRGGYHQREQELGFLQIADGGRINFNFTATDRSLLTEDERNIIQTPGSISDVEGDPDQAPFRSLVSDNRSLDGNISWAKAIIDSGISLSANLNYARSDSRTLQGLNTVSLTDPDGETVLRTFGEEVPLEQRISTDTISSSGSLTKPVNAFRLTSTFNASLSESTQEFDQRFDTSALEADAAAGLLALDADLPSTVPVGFDTAFTRSISGETFTTLRGPIANLPGGELLATFDLGGNWQQIESSDTRNLDDVSLTRRVLTTGANLVIPITSRRTGFADALGSFTLNAQIGLDDVSDFGTLGDYTIGLTWAPTDKLSLSATYITREVAPGLTALGNPEVQFFNVPVFDFTNGETVLATVTTGGNPDLLAETQRDWKFAANWELPFVDNTRFTVEYIRNRSDDVTRAFPLITPEIEAAFPGRITRDVDGTLLAVDRRFVTFAETKADRLQFSLFTRGSIGGGQQGGRPGGGRPQGAGGPPRGGSPANSETPPANGAAGPPRPGGPPGAGGPRGERGAERRQQFIAFRERLCAEDGLEFATRLIRAAENGEDLSAEFPDVRPRQIERILSRIRDDNGEISDERIAGFRERLCSMDPSMFRGGPGGGGQGDRPEGTGGPLSGVAGGTGRGGGPPGQRPMASAAFRERACGEDGIATIRELIGKIERGEDVSAELPGVDPQFIKFGLDQSRDENGNIPDEALERFRSQFCASGPQGQQAGGQGSRQGGGGPAFNPLQRRNFRGWRYFVSLNHTINLESEILIAPGLEPLDELDGDSTNAFGLSRHTSRLEAGIFGNGIGMRLSGRYTGSARLNGSGTADGGDLFLDDLATLDIRLFSEIGQLVGKNEGVLKNFRISLRADNIFDARRQVRDENGETPLNYQPFLIDPVGRFIGVDIRKLF